MSLILQISWWNLDMLEHMVILQKIMVQIRLNLKFNTFKGRFTVNWHGKNIVFSENFNIWKIESVLFFFKVNFILEWQVFMKFLSNKYLWNFWKFLARLRFPSSKWILKIIKDCYGESALKLFCKFERTDLCCWKAELDLSFFKYCFKNGLTQKFLHFEVSNWSPKLLDAYKQCQVRQTKGRNF